MIRQFVSKTLRTSQSVTRCQHHQRRCAAVTSKHIRNSPDEDKFELVYKFPYLVPVRAISRFKIYQTAVTCAGIPFVQSLITSGAIAQSQGIIALVLASTALATLYYLSYITRKLVCIISVTEDMETVRLGRMTFWGNRRNITVPVEEIIPLAEGKNSPNDIYTDITTVDGSVNLYIPLRFGGIENFNSFQQIFGNIRGLWITVYYIYSFNCIYLYNCITNTLYFLQYY